MQSSILFDVLRNILVDKSDEIFNDHILDELKWKTFSKFMVLRYLTMSYNSKVRDIVLNNILHLDRMPAKQLYKWLLKNIPKQNSGFIKYIK